MQELSLADLKAAVKNKEFIIDTRPTALFVDGFVQGAINIVLNENFEGRTNFFTKKEKEFILIVQPQDVEKINTLDANIQAKIKGVHYQGFAEWQENNIPLDLIISVDPYELKLDITHDDKAVVLDVRTTQQYDEEHIVGAVNMQMNDFNDAAKIGLLDEKHNLYLHCNGGTRSVLITSILKRNGFHNIRNIEGGFKAVVKDGQIPLHSNNKKSQN